MASWLGRFNPFKQAAPNATALAKMEKMAAIKAALEKHRPFLHLLESSSGANYVTKQKQLDGYYTTIDLLEKRRELYALYEQARALNGTFARNHIYKYVDSIDDIKKSRQRNEQLAAKKGMSPPAYGLLGGIAELAALGPGPAPAPALQPSYDPRVVYKYFADVITLLRSGIRPQKLNDELITQVKEDIVKVQTYKTFPPETVPNWPYLNAWYLQTFSPMIKEIEALYTKPVTSAAGNRIPVNYKNLIKELKALPLRSDELTLNNKVTLREARVRLETSKRLGGREGEVKELTALLERFPEAPPAPAGAAGAAGAAAASSALTPEQEQMLENLGSTNIGYAYLPMPPAARHTAAAAAAAPATNEDVVTGKPELGKLLGRLLPEKAGGKRKTRRRGSHRKRRQSRRQRRA